MPQIIRTGYADERPDQPRDWLKTNTSASEWRDKDPEFAHGYQMTMTYHHNIPDATWRKFWNLMLFNNWVEEMSAFLYLTGMDEIKISTIIKKLSDLHPAFVTNAKKTGEAAAKGYEQEYADLITEGHNWFVGEKLLLTSDEMDEIATRISWQAWNIVEGPLNSIRSDDPGDKFDDFTGLIDAERSRLIGVFHSYVSKQIDAKNNRIEGLHSAMIGFQYLRDKKVIPFSLDIWEKNVQPNGTIPTVRVNSIPRETWRKKSPTQSAPAASSSSGTHGKRAR